MSGNIGAFAEIIKALDISGTDMLAIALPDSRIVDATSALMRKWRCNKYDIIGRQLSQSGSERFSARYVDDDVAGAAISNKSQIEVTYNSGEGTSQTMRFMPKLYRQNGNEFLMLIARSSANVVVEQDEETELRLKLAIKAGGYAHFDLDIDTQAGTFSPEIHAMIGVDMAKAPLDAPSWRARIHRDDQARNITNWLKGRAESDMLFQSSYRVRHDQGHYVWLEVIAGLVNDAITRQPKKIIGLCRDISDDAQARHRTEISERNLARSQALADIGSWTLNVASGELQCSLQLFDIFNFDAAKSPPPGLDELSAKICDEHKERWSKALDEARAGSPGAVIKCKLCAREGSVQRIELTLDVEKDDRGEVIEIHGICRDVTERDVLESKFIQAQKMESVGRLTGGIAHDFNNLLMVVLGNLQLAEQQVLSNENARKKISAAIDAATRGSELTKRLLAFSRQQALDDETINVNDLVSNMNDMITRAIGEEITLKMVPGEGLWPVSADPSQLENAILNLAINARDAMASGGNLTIETSNALLDDDYCSMHEDVVPGAYVMTAVSDTGHGMPADIIEKVIQPFFTTKPPEAGSGLGLSMIYGFVKQSGGHLNIYSEEGIGTSIKIYLPKGDGRCAGVPDGKCSVKPSEPEATDGEQVVLIVEDNDGVREVAVAMVEDMGYQVLDASNGKDALEIIASGQAIDLLLSDVVMAGMNGPELASKALELRPDLKVLFASGYAPATVRETHQLPSFIELINKPFTRTELTEKVRSTIAQKAAA